MLCTPKPNGFADHYPYQKWLFHWEYNLFSDKPIFFNHWIFFSEENNLGEAMIQEHKSLNVLNTMRSWALKPPSWGVQFRPCPCPYRRVENELQLQISCEIQPVKVDPRLTSDQHEDMRETIVNLKHPETKCSFRP